MAYSSVKVYGSSGYSGYSMAAGGSGYSGYSGAGVSGYSGYSGKSGYSGYSGSSGYSGYSGFGQWALNFIAAEEQGAGRGDTGTTIAEGTMEGWFRTSSSQTGNLIGSEIDDPHEGISINLAGSNISVWSEYGTITGAASYADGLWHHVATTWSVSSNYIRLFFDGRQIGTPSTLASPQKFNRAFTLADGFNGRFSGDINEVRVSTSIRYPSNFTPSIGFFTVDGNTRGYWQVNEGSGIIVRDSTTNNYHLDTYHNLGVNYPIWVQALNRVTGYSGASGYSGYSGSSGSSGYSGKSGAGVSGYSGYSGYSGVSGYSGYSGSGVSGYSGYSGSGVSGYSGYSGYSGLGSSGYSGYSGYSGASGYSGYSGAGVSGYSGYSGYSGNTGFNKGEFSGLIELLTLNKTYTLITKTPYNTRLLSFVGKTGSGYLYADLYDDGSAITGYSGVYFGSSGYSGFSGTPYKILAGSKVAMMISGFSTDPSPYDFGFTLGFDQEGV